MEILKKILNKLRMEAWVVDPKTNEKSVSLTLLMFSYILLCFVGGLQVAEVIQSLSIFPELFWTTTALYFGRKLSPKGKLVLKDSSDKPTTSVDSTESPK